MQKKTVAPKDRHIQWCCGLPIYSPSRSNEFQPGKGAKTQNDVVIMPYKLVGMCFMLAAPEVHSREA